MLLQVPNHHPLRPARRSGSHSPRTIASIWVAFLSRSWISRGCWCASFKELMVLPSLSLRTSSSGFLLFLLSPSLMCCAAPGVLARDASWQKLQYRCRLKTVSNFLLVDISWPEHFSGRQGEKVPWHLFGKAFLSMCSCKRRCHRETGNHPNYSLGQRMMRKLGGVILSPTLFLGLHHILWTDLGLSEGSNSIRQLSASIPLRKSMRIRAKKPVLLIFHLYFCVCPAPLNIPTLL